MKNDRHPMEYNGYSEDAHSVKNDRHPMDTVKKPILLPALNYFDLKFWHYKGSGTLYYTVVGLFIDASFSYLFGDKTKGLGSLHNNYFRPLVLGLINRSDKKTKTEPQPGDRH